MQSVARLWSKPDSHNARDELTAYVCIRTIHISGMSYRYARETFFGTKAAATAAGAASRNREGRPRLSL